MYQKALGARFDTIYIDAFAGSGEVPLTSPESNSLFEEEDQREVIVGSAVRAMSVEPPFTNYIFIDKREACLSSLASKVSSSPNIERVSFKRGDANKEVQKICLNTHWKSKRGVVFLDPFGNQVDWETVEIIARTEALDMWYLFPAGGGVFRQIGKDGGVHHTHGPSLDRMFGTPDWRQAFVKRAEKADLFSPQETQEKLVTPESAATYMMDRMRQIFGGGVLDVKLPLGTLSYPSYYLLFAWGNPSEAAKRLAAKLSRAAIKATDQKYGRTK